MAFVVVYDSSVLYPSTLRDLLIRVAQAGLVQARWTDEILDEVFQSLAQNRPDLDAARLERTRSLMITAVRDCLVTNYASLIQVLDLPDPDDRHVLAAAIRARAQVIVTANLPDFPVDVLRTWDIDPKSPDDFILDQIYLDRATVFAAVPRIADSWRQPPGTTDDVQGEPAGQRAFRGFARAIGTTFSARSGCLPAVAESDMATWSSRSATASKPPSDSTLSNALAGCPRTEPRRGVSPQKVPHSARSWLRRQQPSVGQSASGRSQNSSMTTGRLGAPKPL